MEITVGRFNSVIKQELEELTAFLDEVEKISPKIVLEIGVLRGGVISYFRPKVDQVIGIDFGNHPFGLKVYPDDVIIGDSHDEDTLREVERRLNGKEVDVLFIDGDHSAHGCRMDFDMYSPLVREGGIVAFHDILQKGWHEKATDKHGKEVRVGKVWNDLKRTKKYKWKELICGNTWAGIGILYV